MLICCKQVEQQESADQPNRTYTEILKEYLVSPPPNLNSSNRQELVYTSVPVSPVDGNVIPSPQLEDPSCLPEDTEAYKDEASLEPPAPKRGRLDVETVKVGTTSEIESPCFRREIGEISRFTYWEFIAYS